MVVVFGIVLLSLLNVALEPDDLKVKLFLPLLRTTKGKKKQIFKIRYKQLNS